MTGFELTSSITSSVAWPLTVIALCVVFRKQLRKIPDRLAQFKAGSIEVHLRDELLGKQDAPGIDEGLELGELADMDLLVDTVPIEKVIRQWGSAGAILEIFEQLKEHILKVSGVEDSREIDGWLVHNAPEALAKWQRLRVVRNKVAHAVYPGGPELEDAEVFWEVARGVRNAVGSRNI